MAAQYGRIKVWCCHLLGDYVFSNQQNVVVDRAADSKLIAYVLRIDVYCRHVSRVAHVILK